MATLASVQIRGVFSARPTAGVAGRRFLATDTGVEYYDDGSAWQAVTTDAGQITSGTLPAARLPNPSSSSLGGVQSIASASNQFLTSISTSGVPTAAQPTEANLSLSDITTNNVSITKHGFAPKAPNDATKYLDGTGVYSVPGSTGTVSSVALTVPSWLSVSGSPVTTSGTLAVSATSAQTANSFLATPNGSTGAVGLRTIAAADLPLATTGAFGAVKPDGTTITISSGVITSTASGGMTNPMTTSGDTIYGGASGTPTRLAGGTSGYVLTSNGATSAPSWQAATGGGGGSAYPFNFIQEGQYNSGGSSVTSFTVTFPQALAASGATAFMIVACDGNQTVTTPSGWTADFNQQQSTYARLILLHKTSASDTSATFSVSSSSGFAVLFFELDGSHALDQSSLSGSANSTAIALPSITPTANSLVFGMAGIVTSAITMNPPISPWKAVSFSSSAASSTGRGLVGLVSLNAATNTATRPPLLNIAGTTLFASGGVATATFSIL